MQTRELRSRSSVPLGREGRLSRHKGDYPRDREVLIESLEVGVPS